MKIHIHRWKKFVEINVDYLRATFNVRRTYRHCQLCGKWQREYASWNELFWEDSNRPDGFETLIPENEADKIMKNISLKRNAMP